MTGPPAYPLALAVEDFVPVVLTAAGVITLRRFGEPGDTATAAGDGSATGPVPSSCSRVC